MMRLLHVYKDVYPAVAGGIERHIDQLRRGLPDVRSDVLVCSRSPRTVRIPTAYGTETRVGEFGRVLSVPISPCFPRELSRLQPDLIHLHMPNPMGEVSALLGGGAIPMVASHHADIVRQRSFRGLYAPLIHRCLRRADAIIAGSRVTALQSEFLAPHMSKVRVIRYAVDTARFDPATVPPSKVAEMRRRLGSPLVVAVGRLVYYKGFEHLLDASREIDASVAIVGAGPLEASLRMQAGPLPQVTLTGRVTEDELITILAAADCFVLPSTSRAESFGLATLEAQAMGLPAVVTKVGTGTTEAIQPEATGLVVAPADPGGLAKAITRILQDDALRERMGGAARARAMNDYSLERMADQHRKLYLELIGG